MNNWKFIATLKYVENKISKDNKPFKTFMLEYFVGNNKVLYPGVCFNPNTIQKITNDAVVQVIDYIPTKSGTKDQFGTWKNYFKIQVNDLVVLTLEDNQPTPKQQFKMDVEALKQEATQEVSELDTRLNRAAMQESNTDPQKIINEFDKNNLPQEAIDEYNKQVVNYGNEFKKGFDYNQGFYPNHDFGEEEINIPGIKEKSNG